MKTRSSSLENSHRMVYPSTSMRSVAVRSSKNDVRITRFNRSLLEREGVNVFDHNTAPAASVSVHLYLLLDSTTN